MPFGTHMDCPTELAICINRGAQMPFAIIQNFEAEAHLMMSVSGAPEINEGAQMLAPAAWAAGDAIGKAARLPDDQQPIETNIKIADDLFVKSILVRKAGTLIPQHSHKFDHISLISAGAVAVYTDNEFIGEFEALSHVLIKAGVKHLFTTRLDNTVISCIHRIDRNGEIEVLEENNLF